uniref:Pro-apoptotic WT1 regulator n=1 Tax=Equus asinus asinus TaxID=83772 RepID=A0A8C4MST0_EQUAS
GGSEGRGGGADLGPAGDLTPPSPAPFCVSPQSGRRGSRDRPRGGLVPSHPPGRGQEEAAAAAGQSRPAPLGIWRPVATGRAAAAAAAAPPTSWRSGRRSARRCEPEERDGAPDKGKSSGPSARKGKGQIEKRKLREKRRSTGVVNIPAAECLDEYEDDEAGQKERKREDAITQQNTMQNEAVSLLEPGSSYLLQEPSRTVSGRYKSTTTASEEDVSSRYPRTDRSGFSRYNRDTNASGNLLSSSTLEKKIEDLEKEVVRERQENLRLVRLMQDKEEMIGKLKEEIDLLNRDLDDIEDENEQLKQENKTLLKVVGQLTR